MIADYMPPPGQDTLIMLSINKEIRNSVIENLKSLGYTDDMIFTLWRFLLFMMF